MEDKTQIYIQLYMYQIIATICKTQHRVKNTEVKKK